MLTYFCVQIISMLKWWHFSSVAAFININFNKIKLKHIYKYIFHILILDLVTLSYY